MLFLPCHRSLGVANLSSYRLYIRFPTLSWGTSFLLLSALPGASIHFHFSVNFSDDKYNFHFELL